MCSAALIRTAAWGVVAVGAPAPPARRVPLYGSLVGNPLAAMPSLHFATSVMAAHLLDEAGRLQGAVGSSHALASGFALVDPGEHHVAGARAHGAAA